MSSAWPNSITQYMETFYDAIIIDHLSYRIIEGLLELTRLWKIEKAFVDIGYLEVW